MYDDGGLSGGTMERPALERLLEDIKASKVQTNTHTLECASEEADGLG
jgi:DNA invertase Pin-like site-specific DNA recombinase